LVGLSQSQPAGVHQDHQAKSFFLFIVLIGLQLIRDKYEKQGGNLQSSKRGEVAQADESDHMFGRALFLPIVFMCFSLFQLF
jgi:hypothetical protein